MILYTFSYHFWSGAMPGYNLRGCLSCERSELSLMGIWGLALLKLLYFLRWNSKLQLFLLPTDDNLVQSGAMWVTGIEFRLVCPIINGMYLIYAHQWWLPSAATDWSWLLLLVTNLWQEVRSYYTGGRTFQKVVRRNDVIITISV